MCDGQNKEIQDILRKQEMMFYVSRYFFNSITMWYSLSLSLSQNVNIVGTVSVLLQTLADHFSSKTVGITQKAIQVRRHFKF